VHRQDVLLERAAVLAAGVCASGVLGAPEVALRGVRQLVLTQQDP